MCIYILYNIYTYVYIHIYIIRYPSSYLKTHATNIYYIYSFPYYQYLMRSGHWGQERPHTLC